MSGPLVAKNIVPADNGDADLANYEPSGLRSSASGPKAASASSRPGRALVAARFPRNVKSPDSYRPLLPRPSASPPTSPTTERRPNEHTEPRIDSGGNESIPMDPRSSATHTESVEPVPAGLSALDTFVDVHTTHAGPTRPTLTRPHDPDVRRTRRPFAEHVPASNFFVIVCSTHPTTFPMPASDIVLVRSRQHDPYAPRGRQSRC